jgi:hypothetical protein
MQSLAFAIPLLPGRTAASVEMWGSCWTGARAEAYQDARRRAGITREVVWIQSTGAGDLAVVYLEADDLDTAFAVLGGSTQPFDRWFRERARHVHGTAWGERPTEPRLALDFDINRI